MKRTRAYITAGFASTLTLASFSAQAILLTIDPGTEPFHGPPGIPGTGSYWYNECSPGFWCSTQMEAGPDGGLIIGQTQSASGSHTGPVDGSEAPGIDMPWTFFGNTGMHFTEEPITIISITGDTMLLDFSGWRREWSGIVSDLGGDASLGDTGIAEVVCSIDGCPVGSDYVLSYSYHIRSDDQTGFNFVEQYLRLEGTIEAIPVPAAIWLFGSGLLALMGVAKRKKT